MLLLPEYSVSLISYIYIYIFFFFFFFFYYYFLIFILLGINTDSTDKWRDELLCANACSKHVVGYVQHRIAPGEGTV